ncbi:hypothetical protein PIB30_100286, partial [Stylosanthes scabra]|nr:hypothetical protein [Stylosanthes scabra]
RSRPPLSQSYATIVHHSSASPLSQPISSRLLPCLAALPLRFRRPARAQYPPLSFAKLERRPQPLSCSAVVPYSAAHPSDANC